MATIEVEDGSAKSNSNAYAVYSGASEGDLDWVTYWADRNVQAAQNQLNSTTYPQAAVENALIVAAAEQDRFFVHLAGTIIDPAQAMNLPRSGMCDLQGRDLESDSIPVFVQEVNIQWAWMFLSRGPSDGSDGESTPAPDGSVTQVEGNDVVVEYAAAFAHVSKTPDAKFIRWARRMYAPILAATVGSRLERS